MFNPPSISSRKLLLILTSVVGLYTLSDKSEVIFFKKKNFYFLAKLKICEFKASTVILCHYFHRVKFTKVKTCENTDPKPGPEDIKQSRILTQEQVLEAYKVAVKMLLIFLTTGTKVAAVIVMINQFLNLDKMEVNLHKIS